MRKLLIFFSILIILFNSSCAEDTQVKVNVVSPEEMESLLKAENVQLVDVRTPGEYAQGYIAYAQNIDFMSPTFNEDIKKLDKNKPVFLYCQKGGRSAKCAKKMLDAGFKKIYDLNGGFSKWKHKGLKVKTILK